MRFIVMEIVGLFLLLAGAGGLVGAAALVSTALAVTVAAALIILAGVLLVVVASEMEKREGVAAKAAAEASGSGRPS